MKATPFKFYLIIGATLPKSFEKFDLAYLQVILQKNFQTLKISLLNSR